MLADEFWPLTQHAILSAADCAEIRDRVVALGGRWRRRSDTGFYTLGAASYLDGQQGLPAYLELAAATNGLLRETFPDVLEKIRSFFAMTLGEPVHFDEDYALPGFHVFAFDGADCSRENPSERAHFDLQWRLLGLPQEPEQTVSFTVPIELPTGGGSMYVWHTRYSDAVRLGLSARTFARKQRPQVVSYEPGRAVIHDGFLLHAIGSASIPTPSGYRITLQGHAFRSAQQWVIYW